jgi:hypothetical protein
VKKSDFPAKLRSDPLTDDEINYFNHLKTLDLKRLVKLLPAWARTKKIERAAEFIAGQKPHYPGWTGARAMTAAEFKFPSPHITDAGEYIAEFKRLNGPYKNPHTNNSIKLVQNPRNVGRYCVTRMEGKTLRCFPTKKAAIQYARKTARLLDVQLRIVDSQ